MPKYIQICKLCEGKAFKIEGRKPVGCPNHGFQLMTPTDISGDDWDVLNSDIKSQIKASIVNNGKYDKSILPEDIRNKIDNELEVIKETELQELIRIANIKRQNEEIIDNYNKLIEDFNCNPSSLNDYYEYDVDVVYDNATGGANISGLKESLFKHASRGWRLVSSFTNELGKESSSLGYGGISIGTNSTVDQTVLIYERKIKEKE